MLYVRDSWWSRARVRLGMVLYRAGTRLMGVKIGKGRLVMRPGKVVEL